MNPWMLSLVLASISTAIIYQTVFVQYPADRINLWGAILNGTMRQPYSHRVLKPAILWCIGKLFSKFRLGNMKHITASSILSFVVFFWIYKVFYAFLEIQFTPDKAALGTCLLFVVIPMSAIKAVLIIGDYINLLAHVLGFYLMFTGQWIWIFPILVIGIFNRHHIITLVFFYIAYSLNYMALIPLLTLWAITLIMSYLIFDREKPEKGAVTTRMRSFKKHIKNNTHKGNLIVLIIPVWTTCIILFTVLALLNVNVLPMYYLRMLILLVPYIVTFPLIGNAWELAKFTPMYLVLIPCIIY